MSRGKFPDLESCVIDVRLSFDTHLARARGLGVTASCTSDWIDAAHCCARKVFGVDGYVLARYGNANTWLATRRAA